MNEHIIDVVKIKSERGYGNEFFYVLKEYNNEYILISESQRTRLSIYKIHTFKDKDCRKKFLDLKFKRSNLIGKNK